MAELLVKISYIAFAGAVVCLILAVILFIKFKIPTVIGDLSGKNAKKAIQQMRETNSQKGNPAFKPGKKNERHKKLTEELTFKKKENKPLGTSLHSHPACWNRILYRIPHASLGKCGIYGECTG